MKISTIMQIPSIKILLYISAKGEVRYTELTDLITSRGTLSLNLKELEEEKLIQRRVITTKPIKAYYSLTSKGKQITSWISKIKESLTHPETSLNCNSTNLCPKDQ